MTRRFRFDFSTAYGQLILLVFLPISVLAVVGGLLVLSDTSRAARTLQQATADTLLNRYQTIATTMQPALSQLNQSLQAQIREPGNQQNNQPSSKSAIVLNNRQFTDLQTSLRASLQTDRQDTHLQGLAVINAEGQILVSFGDIYPAATTAEPFGNRLLVPILSKIDGEQTTKLFDNGNGTVYGKKLEFFNAKNPTLATQPLLTNHTVQPANNLWLIVTVDNEPLQLARYQVIIALAITGLLTILLLLLSLNIYARRWIAPIYEMRLHLQRTNATNLYKPMTIDSSGEINQLQQDLVKTLRRLHTSFQDLKNHAEQTEDDLRLAFDEMEMQNISIRNARDAAVSASQTKSAFLANISHELRTPLNSIDGFINLLSRHGGLSAEQDLYVQTIRKSSAHLLALVNDVLDFSKIEAGKLVLDNHEFDLYASIYDVADMLSPLAAEKGLRLAVLFYDDVPRFLYGDALRVKQVMTNLVNNAIKFTDEGEVIIRVSLDDDSDELIEISVQDTGRGISPENQTVLFQSFSQGDPSITRQYGGTGLGLVISKQLTYLMGGQIGFFDNNTEQNNDTTTANPKAKGSTFWFTLPINTAHGNQSASIDLTAQWEYPLLTAYTNQEGITATQPVQLLVWIDHLASLQILKGSLRSLPITITTATSLAGLLQQLKEMGNRWDWVIVDNDVSDDTTALLKQIRLHYAGKLALFGYQVNLDPELLTRYQARALYQPLDRRQLYQLLDNNQASHHEPMLPQWHGFKVLAVDDHLPNLLVLEALLGELGIAVVTVTSGFDAIDYIQQSQGQPEQAVDLIFMDIQMPRMSGSEAASQIRQIETVQHQGKHIPIIALTAHSLSDERDKLLASGIDDYVGKPISQAQLLQILQRWLGKTSTAVLANDQIMPDTVPATDSAPTTTTNLPSLPPPQTTTTNQPTSGPMGTPTLSQPITDEIATLTVIDWEDALMRVAGKPDLAANLLTLLIDSVDQEKADLQQAWQQHDRQALAHVAHRILGASRYTGVPQLRQASQNLEDRCLLNVSNQSPAQFALLAPYYEQLLQALDNIKQADLSPWPQLHYAKLKEHDMAWKLI